MGEEETEEEEEGDEGEYKEEEITSKFPPEFHFIDPSFLVEGLEEEEGDGLGSFYSSPNKLKTL